MSNIVAIAGDKLIFSPILTKPNDLGVTLPLGELYTKYGMIIPMEWNGFIIFDYLEGLMDLQGAECTLQGLLITPTGRIYEWHLGRDDGIKQMSRRRVLWGEGASYCRAASVKQEEQMAMAMHLRPDLLQAVDLVARVNADVGPGYIQLSIPDIMATLASKGFKEDVSLLNSHQPRQVVGN